MEAISTALSIKHQKIPPTPFTEANEESLRMNIVRHKSCSLQVDYALSQSFGFGGACSCVIFGRIAGES
jgi:3-oxoacyl-[acyl-carrier-protein] synthase II